MDKKAARYGGWEAMRLKFRPGRFVDVDHSVGYLLRIVHEVYRVEIDGVLHPTLTVHPAIAFPRGDSVGWVASCARSGRTLSIQRSELVTGALAMGKDGSVTPCSAYAGPWESARKAARLALAEIARLGEAEYERLSKAYEIPEKRIVDYITDGSSVTGWRPAVDLRHGDEFERI